MKKRFYELSNFYTGRARISLGKCCGYFNLRWQLCLAFLYKSCHVSRSIAKSGLFLMLFSTKTILLRYFFYGRNFYQRILTMNFPLIKNFRHQLNRHLAPAHSGHNLTTFSYFATFGLQFEIFFIKKKSGDTVQ